MEAAEGTWGRAGKRVILRDASTRSRCYVEAARARSVWARACIEDMHMHEMR